VPAERPLDEHATQWAHEAAALAARERTPPRVLDLGCGDGALAARLAEQGAQVVGADPSRVALERAAQAHPGLGLVQHTADGRLPLEDSSFEAVVCLNVLQHVVDTQLLMSEARRVLAPHGLLAVAVPWHGRLKGALTALFAFEQMHDPLEPRLRYYTPRSLAALLRAFGYGELELRGRGGAPLWRRTLLARARR
jgi:ubiquinone/menaquinone biosynthesis C-methylase UbiE